MKAFLLALLALATLGGCAGTADTQPFERTAESQERLDRRLAGLAPAGRANCVPAFQAREQRIIDARTILFSANSSGTVYRSEIKDCPQLERDSTLIRRSTQTQICEGEIFEVRDSGTQFPRGACTFGPFTRYERAPN